MTTLESVGLFGVKVHRLTMDQAMAAVEEFIRSGGGHHIVTLDTSAIVISQQDAELRRIINEAALVTPDSYGVRWSARHMGQPLPERVTGVDLSDRLCARAAQMGWRVFFFGSAPGVADDAAVRMAERYPGLQVAGTRNGFFGPADEDSIVAEVAASGADVLFVALGIPKQEKWIARHLDRLGVSVAIGVGGSLDVFSGRVKRAPVIFQRLNLEWLYRLCRNPRKISKVKTLPMLVLMTFLAKLRGQTKARGDGR